MERNSFWSRTFNQMDSEALLGRVFLFYTGFYGKESLPLMGEDGTISGSIDKTKLLQL